MLGHIKPHLGVRCLLDFASLRFRQRKYSQIANKVSTPSPTGIPTPVPMVTALFEANEEDAAGSTDAPTAVSVEAVEVDVGIRLVEPAARLEFDEVCEVSDRLEAVDEAEIKPEDVVCNTRVVDAKDEFITVDEFVVKTQHCTSIGPGQNPLQNTSSA